MAQDLFYSSPNSLMNFVDLSPVARTIYSIANTLFMVEKRIKENKLNDDFINIEYFIELSDSQIDSIKILMQKIVLDVLYEKVRFNFIKKKCRNRRKSFELEECDTICLFSGGVDSTLGIMRTQDEFEKVLGLYVSHGDLGKITKKVEDIQKIFLSKRGIDVMKMIAPPMGKGYSQLRGFLYTLYSMILACFCNAKRIIISECGSTMYQPKFAPFDTITYTTNPFVLSSAKRIGEILLGREFEVVTPFEDFTKTEMMRLMADDKILSITHSCISGRWGINCGTCYACIARMIGSVNLNLSLEYFKNNVFEKKSDMLFSFLNFCSEYMLFPEGIDYWSYKNIKMFSKEDLFRRTSLDVFLAMKKLDKMQGLDSYYSIILKEYSDNYSEDLIEREEELKQIKQPDFSCTVKFLD